METLISPQGHFQLARYPFCRRDLLRAWDAGDEYLLHYLDENALLSDVRQLLIINDSFGALSVALSSLSPVMISDSWLAQQAVHANLKRNRLEVDSVTLLDSLAWPETPLDLVIIKIPKSHALLEEQLFRLRPLLNERTVLVGAGMVKGIHRNTLQLFEKIIGPVRTSLARKKARLVFPVFDPRLDPGISPYPTSYCLEGTDFRIVNHANVFSRERLDIGTRLLLANLPETHGECDVIDLGCGNGVVGLMIRAGNEQARLHFVDESFMAIASAKENFKAAFPGDNSAEFTTGDCLESFAPGSADLVLINPPFHQQHAITASIAGRMFRDAHRVLRPGGECRVVGNRHLGYHRQLGRLFQRCEVVASNPKFVVLSALR